MTLTFVFILSVVWACYFAVSLIAGLWDRQFPWPPFMGEKPYELDKWHLAGLVAAVVIAVWAGVLRYQGAA